MNQKDKAERLRGLLDALENYTEVAVYRESNGNWVKHFLTLHHGREHLPKDIPLDQIRFFDSTEEALEYFAKQTGDDNSSSSLFRVPWPKTNTRNNKK